MESAQPGTTLMGIQTQAVAFVIVYTVPFMCSFLSCFIVWRVCVLIGSATGAWSHEVLISTVTELFQGVEGHSYLIAFTG